MTGRGYAVFIVDLFDLSLLSLHGFRVLAALIFLVDLIELRLHLALKLGKFLLPNGKRQHGHVDQDGHDDDSQTDVGDSDLIENVENAVHEHTQ